jgi:hemolysin activation/secretion protein
MPFFASKPPFGGTSASSLRRYKRRSLAMLGTALLGMSAQAQVINPAAEIARQNQIIERQQQDRLREEQDRAQRALPAPGGTNLQQVRPQVVVPDIGVQCRDIKEIRFNGDTGNLPGKLTERLQGENAGRCLGVAELEASWPR